MRVGTDIFGSGVRLYSIVDVTRNEVERLLYIFLKIKRHRFSFIRARLLKDYYNTVLSSVLTGVASLYIVFLFTIRF